MREHPKKPQAHDFSRNPRVHIAAPRPKREKPRCGQPSNRRFLVSRGLPPNESRTAAKGFPVVAVRILKEAATRAFQGLLRIRGRDRPGASRVRGAAVQCFTTRIARNMRANATTAWRPSTPKREAARLDRAEDLQSAIASAVIVTQNMRPSGSKAMRPSRPVAFKNTASRQDGSREELVRGTEERPHRHVPGLAERPTEEERDEGREDRAAHELLERVFSLPSEA